MLFKGWAHFKLFFYTHWMRLLFEMHITLTLLSGPLLKYSNSGEPLVTQFVNKNDLQQFCGLSNTTQKLVSDLIGEVVIQKMWWCRVVTEVDSVCFVLYLIDGTREHWCVLSLLELNFSSELLTLKFYIENMAMKYVFFYEVETEFTSIYCWLIT